MKIDPKMKNPFQRDAPSAGEELRTASRSALLLGRRDTRAYRGSRQRRYNAVHCEKLRAHRSSRQRRYKAFHCDRGFIYPSPGTGSIVGGIPFESKTNRRHLIYMMMMLEPARLAQEGRRPLCRPAEMIPRAPLRSPHCVK